MRFRAFSSGAALTIEIQKLPDVRKLSKLDRRESSRAIRRRAKLFVWIIIRTFLMQEWLRGASLEKNANVFYVFVETSAIFISSQKKARNIKTLLGGTNQVRNLNFFANVH